MPRDPRGLLGRSGVSGLADAGIVRTGATINFGASGTALRGRDDSCMTLRISQAGVRLDELDMPLFFHGYGPDGDGIKDNIDQCPGAAGLAPLGCPPVAAPPSPAPLTPAAPITPETPAGGKRCSAVKLKGKSLTAARKSLKKAGCKLGRVTKPKRVPKGAKLVITRQSGNGPGARDASRQTGGSALSG